MPLKKLPLLERKKGLYLKKAGAKGRGVFCTTSIRRGELLERTPALIMNEAATLQIDKTILSDYTFIIGEVSKTLRRRAKMKKAANCCAVVMGAASFCNHSEAPNAELLWEERGGSLYYMLRATRAIPKHTEICTTYGDTWFDDRH